MNPSDVSVRPATEDDREFSYQVKKAAEGAYIAALWGWDDERQRAWHTREWQEKRPDVVLYQGDRIGTIYVREEEDAICIGQFFIMPSYQNQGIGSELLRRAIAQADSLGLIMRLAFIEGNPVESLYLRFGFRVVEKKDKYYYMERQHILPK